MKIKAVEGPVVVDLKCLKEDLNLKFSNRSDIRHNKVFVNVCMGEPIP